MITQLIAWENLTPSVADNEQSIERSLFSDVVQLPRAMQTCHGAVYLNWSSPPDNRRKLFCQSFGVIAGLLLNAKRDQGT